MKLIAAAIVTAIPLWYLLLMVAVLSYQQGVEAGISTEKAKWLAHYEAVVRQYREVK